MAGFLFAVTLILFSGGAINGHNSGKTDLYADNPKVLADDVIDSVTDAYKESGPITQDQYSSRFNN